MSEHDCSAESALDKVADEFEREWKDGGRPSLEAYVARSARQFPHLDPQGLLRELLKTELHWRKVAGESPRQEEYEQRLPEQRSLIADVFATSSSANAGEKELPLGTAEQPEQHPTQIGEYRIDRRLGKGAFGWVYLATGPLGRVAIKVPHANRLAVAEARERFLRECQISFGLRHEGIVRAHHLLRQTAEGDPLAVVMDYIDGKPLNEVLRLTSTPLSIPQVVEWLLRLADAVGYAHEQKLIHRDLKPANILIDQRGRPHIADFGLAIAMDGELANFLAGTPAYMSPEQIRGERLDGRTDLWSLGGIMYELLTGRRPFEGERYQDVFARILHVEPIPLSQLNPAVPEELERICLKCLSKDVEERYASAVRLADDLRAFARKNLPSGSVPPDLLVSPHGTSMGEIDQGGVVREDGSESESDKRFDPSLPPFFLPYRARREGLVGRSEMLERIRRELTEGRPTPYGQAVCLQGFGGLGKTQLAVDYAYQYRNSYPSGVIWLAGDQDIDAQLIQLAVKAKWVAPASKREVKRDQALNRLKTYSGCLIVFDNVMDVETIVPFLPEADVSSHLLFTSRKELLDFEPLTVEPLSPEDGMKLLQQEAGRSPEGKEMAAARRIVDRLGGWPLALQIVGRYLRLRHLRSWTSYDEQLAVDGLKAVPEKFLASETGHSRDLRTTLRISEQELDDPGLIDILDVLAWSGTGAMDQSLLAVLVNRKEQEMEEPLSLAMNLSLVSQDFIAGERTRRFRIHRLLQEVRREDCPLRDRREWASRICGGIVHWATEYLATDQLGKLAEEEEHWNLWTCHAIELRLDRVERLVVVAAKLSNNLGNYAKALEYSQNVTQMKVTDTGESEAIYTLEHERACALSRLGRYEESIDHAKNALNGWLKPENLTIQNAVGSLYFICHGYLKLSRTQEALDQVNDFLELLQAHGSDADLYAADVNKIAADIADCSNRPREASSYRRAARELCQACLAKDWPDVSNEIATAICEQFSGTKATIESAEQLAEFFGRSGTRDRIRTDPLMEASVRYAADGKVEEALAAAEAALSSQRKYLGNAHPELVPTLSHIVKLALLEHKYEKAEQFCEQALQIIQRTGGDTNIDKVDVLRDMAICFRQTERPNDALRVATEAYQLARKRLGDQDISVATLQFDIGVVYNQLDCDIDAKEWLQNALRVFLHLEGPGSYRALTALDFLSALQERLGNREAAVATLLKAKPAEQVTVDPQNRTQGTSLCGIAHAWVSLGRRGLALPFFQKSDEAFATVAGDHYLGREHNLVEIARCYAETGRIDDAVTYAGKALRIYRLRPSQAQQPVLVIAPGDFSYSPISLIGKNAPTLIEILRFLVDILLKANRFSEVLQAFRQAKDQLSAGHPDLAALERLEQAELERNPKLRAQRRHVAQKKQRRRDKE
jgi:serine/threonine protein kinase/tetratricopeptide (TPR) repeat protein